MHYKWTFVRHILRIFPPCIGLNYSSGFLFDKTRVFMKQKLVSSAKEFDWKKAKFETARVQAATHRPKEVHLSKSNLPLFRCCIINVQYTIVRQQLSIQLEKHVKVQIFVGLFFFIRETHIWYCSTNYIYCVLNFPVIFMYLYSHAQCKKSKKLEK